jgi:hypothetical protein
VFCNLHSQLAVSLHACFYFLPPHLLPFLAQCSTEMLVVQLIVGIDIILKTMLPIATGHTHVTVVWGDVH